MHLLTNKKEKPMRDKKVSVLIVANTLNSVRWKQIISHLGTQEERPRVKTVKCYVKTVIEPNQENKNIISITNSMEIFYDYKKSLAIIISIWYYSRIILFISFLTTLMNDTIIRLSIAIIIALLWYFDAINRITAVVFLAADYSIAKSDQ